MQRKIGFQLERFKIVVERMLELYFFVDSIAFKAAYEQN